MGGGPAASTASVGLAIDLPSGITLDQSAAPSYRPQSFEASQSMDLRGASYNARTQTVTYDKNFDFRGGGIGDDPIRDAIRKAAKAIAAAEAAAAAHPR